MKPEPENDKKTGIVMELAVRRDAGVKLNHNNIEC